MLIVGLTGGIGSGKSTVAELFSKLGVPIIDADVIAKEILVSDKTKLKKIIAHFGPKILNEKAELDRAKLRKCLFKSEQQRQWLEKLLHPNIVLEIKQRILNLKVPYCIVVIPLLIEIPKSQQLVDRILVVDAPEELQIARVLQRDQLTAKEVESILAVQATREQRLNKADDVIGNINSTTDLQLAVAELHQRYMSLFLQS